MGSEDRWKNNINNTIVYWTFLGHNQWSMYTAATNRRALLYRVTECPIKRTGNMGEETTSRHASTEELEYCSHLRLN